MLRKRVVASMVAMAVVGLSAVLCGCPPKGPAPEGTPPTMPTGTPGATAELEGSITVKGSDTMVHLVSAWAEAFMKQQPKVDVSVTGGGSGTGVAAMINRTTDICAASRELKDDEKKDAEAKEITPVEFTVARDGIAVIVNPANPVSELTLDQLAKIFTGATTNWKQVGGPDQKIIILSRESSSGTYAFFQEHVLDKKDYAKQARLMPATSGIIEATAADKTAIGYVGLGYAVEAGATVKALKVKADEKSPGVAPSEQTVKDGSYGIARPLYLFTAGEPAGPAKAFIDFCKSRDGQAIVQEQGYVTVE